MLCSNRTANRGDDGATPAPADDLTAAAAQHSIPPLDLGKIAEMESLIGQQAVANMLNMIRADIIDHIPVMIDDLVTGNAAQACKAAHRLKGAASLLGAPRLTEGLTQLEKTAVDGGNIQHVINHLRQVATDTLRAIADRD